VEITKIEEKIDRTIAGATEISMEIGGIRFQSMTELFEMAKLMAVAEKAVPKHLRGNPGACLAVCIQALEWRMSPFSVANKSYEVNDRIAYEAQLIVGVVNARAPLKERLRYKYEGEGADMRCTVSGVIKGETAPLEYTSPPLSSVKKNSPLWTSDPQQQLGFYSARAWARRHCPETILGIYGDDELRDSEPMKDVTPKPDVGERLKGGKGKRGFSHEGVTQALEHKAEPETVAVNAEQQPAETQTIAAADVEPPIARGQRLLAICKSKPEIVDLRSTILDELTDKAQIKHWNALCDGRAAELKD
jgi:hypothetical protein